jgi:adenosylhomocysteinase
MAKNSMKPGMYDVPAEIDRSVMEAKLASMNITLDTMTPEQEEYMKSWVE